MKKLLLNTLFIVLAVFAVSCSSPLEKKYNSETEDKDIESLKTELDTADLRLILGTMFRMRIEDKDFEGMTYRELLEDGKRYKAEQERIEAEQQAMAEKAAREEAERVKRLQDAVMVSCYEKGFYEGTYEDYITYKFVIKNKSDKDIRALKGMVVFNDIFDEKISALGLTYDQPIEAGKEITWNATTDYNQFKSEDRSLRNKDLKDMKVVWVPEKLIFRDGTTLE